MSFSLADRRAYYANASVRARIVDFFSDESTGKQTAMFLAIGTDARSEHRDQLPVEELRSWMDSGAELNRSLWDRETLICHLDLEYVNFDNPAYGFLNPERIFELQEPVLSCAVEFLESFAIRPLILMTGRGYHLMWRIRCHSKAFASLAELGILSPSLKRHYSVERTPTGEQVTSGFGSAFSGLGMLMEFVGQAIKVRAAPKCQIPVEMGAIETGGGANGREMISVDVTEYADPLSGRTIRAPFSVYLKPYQQSFLIGDQIVNALPPLIVIPTEDLTLPAAIALRQDPVAAGKFAETASSSIPTMSGPMERLIEAYHVSPLAHFHSFFYSQEHDAPAQWPTTYDQLPEEMLPPCTRTILAHPNDLLLRPGCVQRVVRVMLSLGWHPRHIAGLLRSKYERDYSWGDQWRGNDPATRADFYARLFTGLFVTQADDLIDFNCQSARQEGICFVEHCNENLVRFQQSLKDRRKYERLACRPINRLFLPKEHT